MCFSTDAYMYYYPHGVAAAESGAGGIIITIPASYGGGSKGQFGHGRSFTNEQLVLTMPEGSSVHDIGHLVIWCKLFRVFFNQAMGFPNPLVFPTNTTTVIVNTTSTTPTTTPASTPTTTPATTTPTEPPTAIIVTILPLQIGTFTNTQHGVAGTVYADNNSTIRIENFHYDGLGPGELVLLALVSYHVFLYRCIHVLLSSWRRSRSIGCWWYYNSNTC